MRQIWVYYEDGKILGYSAREDPAFSYCEFILVPLNEMRKFYDGKDNITFYEILNSKLQKKDNYIYDESYINNDFFEIGLSSLEADFRIVCFKDCIVIFSCDIDHDDLAFREKLEDNCVCHPGIWFYFTKKDDPSILYKKATFDGVQTALTVILEEDDFTIFVTDPAFTYSLEFV